MLDTPGHSAFFLMRDHGASVSDFLLLVVAANEGKPASTSLHSLFLSKAHRTCLGISGQSIEVLETSKDSNIPMIVAINKIDVATPQQIENVYTQLHQHEALDPSITRETNPYLKGESQEDYVSLFLDNSLKYFRRGNENIR